MFAFLPPLPAPLPPAVASLLLCPTFPRRGFLAAALLALLGFGVRPLRRPGRLLAWRVSWRGRSLPFRSPGALAVRLCLRLGCGVALGA